MRVVAGLLMAALVLGGCAQSPERQGANTRAAKYNVELGIQYMNAGMKGVALEKLKKALKQDPDLPEAHHAIAVFYESVGENELAEKHFRKTLRLDSDNSSARNDFGKFLCERGMWAEAEDQFLRAAGNPLFERPENPLTNAGVCAKRNGDMEKAELYFRKAVQANPLYPRALLLLAKLMAEKGEHLKARAYLQRFHSVLRPTPESLWLGIKVERALGDKGAAASYALKLRNDFPDSPYARRLAEEEEGDGGRR